MLFNDKTAKLIKNMSKDDKFAYFFNNIESYTKISKLENETLDKITEMAIQEFDIPDEKYDKVKFFLKLGYWSKHS